MATLSPYEQMLMQVRSLNLSPEEQYQSNAIDPLLSAYRAPANEVPYAPTEIPYTPYDTQQPMPQNLTPGQVKALADLQSAPPKKEEGQNKFEDMLTEYQKKLSRDEQQRNQLAGVKLQGAEQLLSGYQAPMDLSPLYNYMDTMYGTNLAKGAPKPQDSLATRLEIAGKGQAGAEALKEVNRGGQYDVLKLRLQKQLADESNAQRDELARLKMAFGFTAAQMKQSNLRPLHDNAINKISEYETSSQLLNNLGEEINSKAKLMGPIVGRFKSMNPYDQDVQFLRGRIETTKQIVAKAMEGGVLRKEDTEKYNKILASIENDPTVAVEKIQELNKDIERQKSIFLKNLGRAGFNTQGFEQAAQASDSAQSESPDKAEAMKQLKARGLIP